MISVVTVQYNHASLTRSAVESIQAWHNGGFEIIVVDNCSTEPGARDATSSLPGCTVIFNAVNAGFGRANNLGALQATGEILFFLNNDTRLTGSVFPELEGYFAAHPRCGVVGPRLVNPDGSPQRSTGKAPTFLSLLGMKRGSDPFSGRRSSERGWVSGAALAIRKEAFDAVGGFDERYFMYYEDVDLCARVRRAGYEIHAAPEISIEHSGGGSQPGGLSPFVRTEYRRSQLLLFRAHASAADNALLRLYLLARFLPERISPSAGKRNVASAVLSMALGNPDADRH